MTRIFLTLATLSSLMLVAAIFLGLSVGDPRLPDPEVQRGVTVHFLFGVASLVFAVLVHALVLTYFMGTGRWLEETSAAYHLDPGLNEKNRSLKWALLPSMMLGIGLLIMTGALGGAADPASAISFQGWGSFSAAEVHLWGAVLTVTANVAINVWEYVGLRRNGALVTDVLQQVRQIRIQRGLPV